MSQSYLTNALLACEEVLSDGEAEALEWQTAYRRVGNVLQGMGRLDQAIEWHSRALEDDPSKPAVYGDLAQLYARQQEFQRAIASCKVSLELKPKQLKANWYLAQIHGYLGNKEEEIASWWRALNMRPDKATPQGHFDLGKAFQQRGDLDKAMVCYKRAVRQDSQFVRPYYNLAEIFSQRQDWARAIGCYQRITEKQPKEGRAYYLLGKLQLEQSNCEGAIAALSQAIKLKPNATWYYRPLISALVKQERWDETIVTCRAVINSVGQYPWAYASLGKALAVKGDLKEANIRFQKASALSGWELCIERDYQFKYGGFAHYIPIFQEHFQPLQGGAGVRALEVGKSPGIFACWLLDNVLTHQQAQLTCVARNCEEQFKVNIVKTGANNKVEFFQGKPHKLLPSLEGEAYDLVQVYEGADVAEWLQQKAALAWKLLKVGGIFCFKYYNPSNSVLPFLYSLEDKAEVLHESEQIIVRKVG